MENIIGKVEEFMEGHCVSSAWWTLTYDKCF